MFLLFMLALFSCTLGTIAMVQECGTIGFVYAMFYNVLTIGVYVASWLHIKKKDKE